MSSFLLNLALRGAGLAPVAPAASAPAPPVLAGNEGLKENPEGGFEELVEEFVEEQAAPPLAADRATEQRATISSASTARERLTERDNRPPRPEPVPEAPPKPPPQASRTPEMPALTGQTPSPVVAPGERIERVIERTVVERHTEHTIAEPAAERPVAPPLAPQEPARTEIHEITREVIKPSAPGPLIPERTLAPLPVQPPAPTPVAEANTPLQPPKVTPVEHRPSSVGGVRPEPKRDAPEPRAALSKSQQPTPDVPVQLRREMAAPPPPLERTLPIALPRVTPAPAPQPNIPPPKQERPAPDREISVRIGSIEIKAPSPAPSTLPPPAAPARPEDFSEYRALRSYSWFRG